jgi:hypothetical protein
MHQALGLRRAAAAKAAQAGIGYNFLLGPQPITYLCRTFETRTPEIILI